MCAPAVKALELPTMAAAAFGMLILRERDREEPKKSVVAAQRDFQGTALEQCHAKHWMCDL